jgi:acetyl-CoA acyltransferase 2
MNDQDIVFVAYKRTPFGSFGGSLAHMSATDLATHAARGALLSLDNKVKAEDLEASFWGQVCQSSADAIYIARHTALRLGMPLSAPSLTVNRLCGSGFEAIAQGAAFLRENSDKNCVLVGGSESMSQVPFVLRGARWGYRMGHGEVEDYLTASLIDQHVNMPMAITAENLATEYSIDRKTVDDYALLSQKRAWKATESGELGSEIFPVTLKTKKGDLEIKVDEHIRKDASPEGLEKLKPVFKKDGVVTAGNASGMVDGAAALILAKRGFAEKKNLPILGTLQGYVAVGCDPKVMGIGPVPATKRLLDKIQKSIGDFHRIEVNEAFAPQYLAVEKALGLPREKTNLLGGAIAIGHPLGASGARLVGSLLLDIKRRHTNGWGLATACIGGGQGMSVALSV